jgi:MULE transposase domain
MGEICRIRKDVLRADIWLDANDVHSTRIWVSKLQSQGDFVYYKDKQDPPPEGSDLADNLFALYIQTKYQVEAYKWLGNGFLGIDTIHNVTQYKGILLFTLMAWDEGVPVAWMLSSNSTQLTIEFFLNLIKAQSPGISPSIFMTDRDQAQINAIRSAFPDCGHIFYCWWHVLRAIRTHFNIL